LDLSPADAKLTPHTRPDVAHVRVQTATRFRPAIRIEGPASLRRAERLRLLALTDIGNLFGALEFATTCTPASDRTICRAATSSQTISCKDCSSISTMTVLPSAIGCSESSE
jgi:DNA polymerase III alpha subunit